MAQYNGTIDLLAGIRPINNGTFALVNAPDVQVDNADKRLDEKLTEIDAAIALKAPINNPTFTGTPKSVTPTSTSNAKMIATKEYVDNSTPDVYYADCEISIDNMTTAYAYISGAYNEKAGNIIIVNFTGVEGSTYSLSAEAQLQIIYNDYEGATVAKYIYYGVGKKISSKMINVGDTCVFIYSGNNYTLVNPSVLGTVIDDSAGNGVKTKTWSADKVYDQLALKANITSPTLKGTPKSVTPTSSSDAKMITTKEYVDNAATDIEKLVYTGCAIYDSSEPGAHLLLQGDSIHELGTGYICIWTESTEKTVEYPEHLPTSSGNGWKVYSIKSYIESKAPTASPTFTGTPKSVTPSSTSNAKMIATKEYVDNAISTGVIDDNTTSTTKTWSSNKIDSTKADKVSSATNNNFAALDANGNLKDSGHKHSDYLTSYDPILLKHSIDIDANTSSNYVWSNAIFPNSYPAKDYGHCYVADYYISNPKAFASDITVKYLANTLSIDYTLNPNSSATTITFTLCKQSDATTTMKLHTGYQYAEKVASTSKTQSIIDIYGR